MTEIVQALNKEISEITAQIERLEAYKRTLIAAIEANLSISRVDAPLRAVNPSEGSEIQKSSNTSSYLPQYPQRGHQPNTLEMVKVVLKNAKGEEKTPDELRHLIRSTFGVDPAKSLDQMLYKRSAKGTVFYKTSNGRFGLCELKGQREQSLVTPMLLELESKLESEVENNVAASESQSL